MAGTTSVRIPMNKAIDGAKREAEIHQRCERAVASDRFMIACYRISQGQIQMTLDMQNLPNADFTEVVRMLQAELAKVLNNSTETSVEQEAGASPESENAT